MTTTTITCGTPIGSARLTVGTDEVGAELVMSRATDRSTAPTTLARETELGAPPTTLARATEFGGDIGSISGCFRKAELAPVPLQLKWANHG
ncbi:hypothetical protein [Microterricola pindariensis]|uniref:hypothetical protein n=1 Tax=Microterricola pindariensis TaxID=478010 RepID=UPI0010572E66|nr:hypothetical protein [Microterricola pindariensis]